MRILGVGIATLDIVNVVDGYPEEDAEIRALSQRVLRGGNVTNTLVVLSQLGYQCSWAGEISDDASSKLIRDDLNFFRINMDNVAVEENSTTPTSYVTLNQKNGSRTIVHYRQLGEYNYQHFEAIDFSEFDWIHFEGRNVVELTKMMDLLASRNYKNFSLEVEKYRQGIEALFGLPALLIFSRAYVRDVHVGGVKDFFEDLTADDINVPAYCSWGKSGAWAMDVDGKLHQQPAYNPEKVVDTLGAGDVFNAAVIDATLRNEAIDSILKYACKVSGLKCGQYGFDHIKDLV